MNSALPSVSDYPTFKELIWCAECGAKQAAEVIRLPDRVHIRIHDCAECKHMNLADRWIKYDWIAHAARHAAWQKKKRKAAANRNVGKEGGDADMRY